MNVLVVGLGLIGGSVAKSLKKHTNWNISGYDCSEQILNDAIECGAIDSEWEIGKKCDADLTVLCLTPSASIEFLQTNAKYLKNNSVVTDVCGIKKWIVSRAEEICSKHSLHFIGGHPMAGKERSGFKNSDENLFNRASYILTPTASTSKKAYDVVKCYINALNTAKITVTTPENHDRMIAFTSQIPHIIAGAYVKSPSCLKRKGFSAGSFKDVSRVATVDEHLWSELFLNNKEMLLSEIESLLNNINKYKQALVTNDIDALKRIIKEGRIIKEEDLRNFEKEKKGERL